jgi:hypothetical protein
MNVKFFWHIVEKYFDIQFHEIYAVEAELFHVDWWTDNQANLIVAFCNILIMSVNSWNLC